MVDKHTVIRVRVMCVIMLLLSATVGTWGALESRKMIDRTNHINRITKENKENIAIRRNRDATNQQNRNIAKGHKRSCKFRAALVSSAAIECEHGYDVCPKCDPCTCEEK